MTCMNKHLPTSGVCQTSSDMEGCTVGSKAQGELHVEPLLELFDNETLIIINTMNPV